MIQTPTRLIVFDIDGTLLLSGPVSRTLFGQAFEEIFSAEAPFGDLSFAGRTDRGVLSILLRRLELQSRFDEGFPPFAARYGALMREFYPTAKGPRLMPGVEALLSNLHQNPSTLLLVGSGNLPQTARVKLDRFGLRRFLPHGVYGDIYEDRAEIFEGALRLARVRLGWNGKAKSTWIVGDTVSDVEAAREVGARSLAVATGPPSLDDPRTAHPDAFLLDLSSLRRTLAILLS